jgi:tripeptide aminopeptidase
VSSAALDLFLELAAIPSPPGHEGAVAARVTQALAAAGLAVEEDDAGSRVSSDANNLLCRLPGTTAGIPVLFCAHLDTVPPAGAIEPVVEDGVVRNRAGTILGADNKAAVAAMVEGVRRVAREGRPHAGIELLLTLREEDALQGAYAFDRTRLEARVGFVYDEAADIGRIVVGSPSAVRFDVAFSGRAAHAGIEPEEGRSAIAAAARAVADLRLGRLDDQTTANIGLIHGGSARNIVPERCSLVGEARSHDEATLADVVREMTETFAFAATLEDCRVETTVTHSYRAYSLGRNDLAVSVAGSALARCGFTPSYALTGGGADANVFNERQLPCVVLANGMREIHSAGEHIAVADIDAMVDVTLAIVDTAAAAGP